MPLEVKDIFEALKLKPVETKEELITSIEEAGWIMEDQIFKDEKIGERIFGRAFGTASTNVAKTFRSLGIDITGAELKNPIEKIVEIGLGKLHTTFEDKKKEIENNSKLTIDERIKAAEEAKGQLAKKVSELEGLVKSKAEEFERTIQDKEKEVKTIRLSTIKSEAERKLPYLPDLDPYKKKGWLAEMNEKYRIETEEDGSPFIVAADSGARIKSTKHAGTFLSVDDVYIQEATKAGIVTIAPNGGKPKTETSHPATPAPGTPQARPNPNRVVAAAAQVNGG